FLRWRAPSEVGHNSLAALAYVGIYVLFLIQILTGFALYSNDVGTGIWHTLFGWLPGVVNIQTQREIHFFIMFMLIGFTIHHIYSSWLVSREKRNGTLDSIFSGYKYVTDEELAESEAERHVVPVSVPLRLEPPEPSSVMSNGGED
ncbi:MAG: cytochrome b/b6 domain-containing protein, partial [Nitrolancea sp.]